MSKHKKHQIDPQPAEQRYYGPANNFTQLFQMISALKGNANGGGLGNNNNNNMGNNNIADILGLLNNKQFSNLQRKAKQNMNKSSREEEVDNLDDDDVEIVGNENDFDKGNNSGDSNNTNDFSQVFQLFSMLNNKGKEKPNGDFSEFLNNVDMETLVDMLNKSSSNVGNDSDKIRGNVEELMNSIGPILKGNNSNLFSKIVQIYFIKQMIDNSL